METHINPNQTNKIFVINDGKKEFSLWNIVLDEFFYDDEPELTINFIARHNNSTLR